MLGYFHMNDQTDPEIDWFLLNGTVAGFDIEMELLNQNGIDCNMTSLLT